MAIVITGDCINCGACEAECPLGAVKPKMKSSSENESIYINNRQLVSHYISFDHYYVNPGQCNNCEGKYLSPRCNTVCPVACCVSEDELNDEGNVKIKISADPVYVSKISLN